MANPKGQSEIKAERRLKTYQLRKQGKTLQEIANIHGCAVATIQSDLMESKGSLAALTEDLKAEWRQTVLDKLLVSLGDLSDMRAAMQEWTKAGSPKHMPAAVQVIAQIDKTLKSIREMLGLDAPVEVRQSITLEQFGGWASGVGDWVVRMAESGVSGQALIDSWLAERGQQGQPAIEGSYRVEEG